MAIGGETIAREARPGRTYSRRFVAAEDPLPCSGPELAMLPDMALTIMQRARRGETVERLQPSLRLLLSSRWPRREDALPLAYYLIVAGGLVAAGFAAW